jgi:hypothetical protein
VHGALLEAEGRRLVPWLHPAAGLRSRAVRAQLFEDARALPGVLASVA